MKVLQKTALVFLGLLAATTILELYLRSSIPVQPPMTLPDEATMYRLRPNLRVKAWVPGVFQVTYRTNAQGFRGSTAIGNKATGTTRILGLGDSFTFGIGVEDDATYLALLEQKLRRVANVEVINAGVFGWGTAHELAFFEKTATKLRPEIVIVGFFENDLRDNLLSGLFHVRGDDLEKATPEMVQSLSPHEWWLRRSPLYEFIAARSALVSWMRMRMTVHRTHMAEAEAVRGDGGTSLPLELRLTALLLRRFRQQAESIGAKLMFVLIPSASSLEALQAGKTPDAYERLRRLCREARVNWLPVGDDFLTSGKSARWLYFARDLHLTADGHAIVADALARRLQPELEGSD
jgi:lysophospholipase L1-like esterase